MNDFEYGLPVAWLVEFTDALNKALDFRKFDVTLKPSLEYNRLVDKIKGELSSFLPYG